MQKEPWRTFEDWIAKLFREADYTVEQNYKFGLHNMDIDVVAEKDGKQYCVEVKRSHVTDRDVRKILTIANALNMNPILITFCHINEEKLEKYTSNHSELIVMDIHNLLYAVRDHSDLWNELVAMMPYSVQNIEPQEGFISIDILKHSDGARSLITELESCKGGHGSFRKYEDVCTELLKIIMADDLTLWETQQKSNCDLYRFDLLCRIKDGNQKSFWSILERYFNSKYVVFEFKNYKEEITQREIYTTERYLYAKALRSVALIFSANGYNENASWAAKGCLRENGKLILLLSSQDLIKMYEIKMDNEDPSEYLLNKLDELLLELEK